ncbi:hypothetical protein Poli38472_002477 [Pythium oligandrum]|uniref:Uncharacterized protein n=1 Tax=Pythium oligandrum TaxID=41045 RepID=A0A8K1CIT2_PYTOL|nr:hypothetical protein Poli38472_002477 [Pythium oligandrum]|eukprot:TMW63536.1 hypothetical protein Poli38472_002477 [Pythium oligandrum]
MLLKTIFLAAVVAAYWQPLEIARFVAPEEATALQEMHVHIVRFALTIFGTAWALATASSYYVVMIVNALQMVCWASSFSDERVLGDYVDGLDHATEKKVLELAATAFFALMWVIILFTGGSSKDPYRQRLVAFYSKHNPPKLADVDKILKKYKGQEELLFTRLQRKYSVLSHTAEEAAVDEIDNEATPTLETVEEVEFIREAKTPEAKTPEVDDEDEESYELVQPHVRSPVNESSTSTSSSTSFVQTASSIRTASPPQSPPVTNSSKSNLVQAAIAEARRAQQERVQQRIAQLAAKAKQ